MTSVLPIQAAPVPTPQPCPSWCAPGMCEHRIEEESNGQLTAVAVHYGLPVGFDPIEGTEDSDVVTLTTSRIDLGNDVGDPIILLNVGGGLPEFTGLLSPARARLLAAALLAMAEEVEPR